METADAVLFDCPECGHIVKEELKDQTGQALLYKEESVPKAIADIIVDSVIYCPNCGDRFKVEIDTHCHTVPLFLRKD
jgi:predicted RNA-binding Zn-ribbon protein involved in translation (DUF1610 family)